MTPPLSPHKTITKIMEQVILHSWWVVLFVLICYAAYERALFYRDIEYNRLHSQLVNMEYETEVASALQKNLKAQINSQSDPVWIELVLIKRLGLVPEGQLKIFFTETSPR
jgi:hypothetical protein